jgi:serine-type D-Ala-D-Ala carboxypeptidase/endopeptidase
VLSATLACAALRGQLRLDEPLGVVLEEAKHLPHWLTLQRIATHTACLPAQPPGIYRSWWRDRKNPWAHFSNDDLLSSLRKLEPPREKPAQSAWRYSNFGYALLGAALERRTGQSYQTLVDSWIARPYGLTSLQAGDYGHGGGLWQVHTGSGKPTVPWDFTGATAAAGALRGSIDDLLHWGMLIADPPSALRPAVELARACRVELTKPIGHMVGFCLGWGICRVPGSQRELWVHEGATYGSLSVLALSLDDVPSAVALARNRGISLRSLLDRRSRAIEPTLLALSSLLVQSPQG